MIRKAWRGQQWCDDLLVLERWGYGGSSRKWAQRQTHLCHGNEVKGRLWDKLSGEDITRIVWILCGFVPQLSRSPMWVPAQVICVGAVHAALYAVLHSCVCLVFTDPSRTERTQSARDVHSIPCYCSFCSCFKWILCKLWEMVCEFICLWQIRIYRRLERRVCVFACVCICTYKC